MDTGLVHRHGHLSGHTNHTPTSPQNFHRGCRDFFVIRPVAVSQRSHRSHPSPSVHRLGQADSIAGGSTAVTSRSGGTSPPAARASSARHSSSASVSSGGGPSSTVTTQSWQARPPARQGSPSIFLVLPPTGAGAPPKRGHPPVP